MYDILLLLDYIHRQILTRSCLVWCLVFGLVLDAEASFHLCPHTLNPQFCTCSSSILILSIFDWQKLTNTHYSLLVIIDQYHIIIILVAEDRLTQSSQYIFLLLLWFGFRSLTTSTLQTYQHTCQI